VLLVSFGCFFEGVFLGASSTLFNNILTYLSKKSFSWGSCRFLVCCVVLRSLWGASLCICLRALLGF
jgi:hypothetical protein